MFNVAITRARANLIVVGDYKYCSNCNIVFLSEFANYIKYVEGSSKKIYDILPQTDIASKIEQDFYSKLVSSGIHDDISLSKTHQAYAIKYLVSLGFDISWREHPLYPILPNDEIVGRIEELIAAIGGYNVVLHCILGLSTKYSPVMNRYIIPRNASLYDDGFSSFPYVYLLNIALKKLNFDDTHLYNEKQQKLGEELDSLVSNYMICYDLERFYPMINLDASNFPLFIIKEVLFDTYYIPKQLPSEQVELLINKFFDWVHGEDASFFKKIQQYNRIFRNVNYKLKQEKYSLPVRLQSKNLWSLGLQNIKDLSIKSIDLNKNYMGPNTQNLDFDNAAFSNPIIDCGNNKFLALPSPIFSHAFFEKLYMIVRNHIDNIKNTGYTSRKIGEGMKCLTYDTLIKKLPQTFHLYKNKEYKISKSLQKNTHFLERKESVI